MEVTLKAVRDELAALGHDLSEDVVASLLVDAGAADLLASTLEQESIAPVELADPFAEEQDSEAELDGNAFGPGTTVYINQNIAQMHDSRRSSGAEPPMHNAGVGDPTQEDGGYESEDDTGRDFSIPARYGSPDETSGLEEPQALSGVHREQEAGELRSAAVPGSGTDWPFGVDRLAELWDTVLPERSEGEQRTSARQRPYTARPSTARQGGRQYSPNSTGLSRPRSSLSWTRVPTLNKSYIVPALAPPTRTPTIDRVSRYKEMQRLWEADPFLQAGAGGAKGRRKVPDYRAAFAACHEAEERTRQQYLTMRSHRQLPIMEAPTLKRRDSLMWEQRQRMQLQDFP